MAFNISERLIDTYQEGIDSIIEQLGKEVIIVKNPIVGDCPNCGYDKRRKRSNGRYNTNNPNPEGALNKPFVNGQRCPVCNGRGTINSTDQQVIIKATIKWDPKELYTLENGDTVKFSEDICKIKTYATHFDDIKKAEEFLVAYDEAVEGSPKHIKCKLFKGPTPRGLKYSRYTVAYLKVAE